MSLYEPRQQVGSAQFTQSAGSPRLYVRVMRWYEKSTVCAEYLNRLGQPEEGAPAAAKSQVVPLFVIVAVIVQYTSSTAKVVGVDDGRIFLFVTAEPDSATVIGPVGLQAHQAQQSVSQPCWQQQAAAIAPLPINRLLHR